MKKGFSLIELLIVFSIISILSTFSVHGVRQLIDQKQQRNAVTALTSALMSAQAYSRSSGFKTILCPSVTGVRCDSHSDWSNGWINYIDSDESHTLNNAERVIAVKNNVLEEISYNLAAPGNPQKIIFYRNGRLWPNSSFTVCHRKLNDGSKIIMTQSGRIRTEKIEKSNC